MYTIPTPPGGRSSGQMSYPLARMLETASQIITNANNSLTEHDSAWKKVEAYVQTFPGFMQGAVMAMLVPYANRLRASYQWQLDLATTLIDGVTSMEGADSDVANSFTPQGFGRNHLS